jgi:hypothetical protein
MREPGLCVDTTVTGPKRVWIEASATLSSPGRQAVLSDGWTGASGCCGAIQKFGRQKLNREGAGATLA